MVHRAVVSMVRAGCTVVVVVCMVWTWYWYDGGKIFCEQQLATRVVAS